MYGNGMDMGMDSMAGMGESTGKLQQLWQQLPPWASALLITLAVLAVGALLGRVLGGLYASVRYPDPEKQTAVHPLMRVVFLCALVLCALTLYRTLAVEETPTPGEDSSMVAGEGEADGGGTSGSTGGSNPGRPSGGGGAVMVSNGRAVRFYG